MERVSFALLLCSFFFIGSIFAATITIDGIPNDWPGNPSCTIGTFNCSKVADDPVESAVGGPDGIQPQWDLVSVWYTEDASHGYIRFDTYAKTDMNVATYVKICLDIPNVGPGAIVSGCGSTHVDTLIYVHNISATISGIIVDCNSASCSGTPSTGKSALGFTKNNVTEISYLLTDAGTPAGANTTIGIFFDNGDLPSDDFIFGIPTKIAPPPCTFGNAITIDGTGADWPSNTLITTDVYESLSGSPDGVQAQWDIGNVYITDDGTHGYIRYDTRSATSYGASEFVKVCFSLPGSNGDLVPGCGVKTDSLIYIFESNHVTHTLTARIYDCAIVACNSVISEPTYTTITAVYSGSTTEISFPLNYLPGYANGTDPNVVIFFDNGDLPADDRVPNSGSLVYIPEACVKDCFGVSNGNATYDACGICGGNVTKPAGCIPDCHGVKGGNATYDSCGVCGGDGTSCKCHSNITITIDGNGSDWPGSALVATDPQESAGGDPAGVQPQWDIINFYAFDDGTNGYLRFDTFANTDWTGSQFVKVCIHNPNTTGGVSVPGCTGVSGFTTDALIYIYMSDKIHNILSAEIINCHTQACGSNVANIATFTLGTAITTGKITEIKYPLNQVPGYQAGVQNSVIVFFDNGDLPADDRVPNSGALHFTYFNCTVDCFGVSGGHATYDACGVCGGDGTSCLCVNPTKITVDGIGSDWTGSAGFTVDPTESAGGDPNGVQPQWDITNMFATDDGQKLFVRFDTAALTQYNNSEYVKVCIGLPGSNLGDNGVPACSGINTDSMIYIYMSDKATNTLTAKVFDCRIVACTDPPSNINTFTLATAVYKQSTTEVSVSLSTIRVNSNVKPEVIVFFDNGDLPADDRVPNTGFLTYTPFSCEAPDCLGVAGGNATYDSCGVCAGDGTSCKCKSNITITVDGNGSDWPSATKVATDPQESAAGTPDGVQPQWDIIDFYAFDDGTNGYIRFDTFINADLASGSQYIKVCIHNPGAVGGDNVPGCTGVAGFTTDALIYVWMSNKTTNALTADIFDCHTQQCNTNPANIPTSAVGTAVVGGKTIEIKYPLTAIPGYHAGIQSDVIVFFDNGDLPADDRVPDNGVLHFTFFNCTVDCLGVVGGFAKYDSCGVCNGDGTSCLCLTPAPHITADGNPADWTGELPLGTDAQESLVGTPDGVQPQYDILTLYASDNGVTLSIRWDTAANTVYDSSEFVKVCIGLPDVLIGDTVPGCGGIKTDSLIYVFRSTATGRPLTADIYDCRVVDCAASPATISPSSTGTVAVSGKVTELNLLMSDVRVDQEVKPLIVVYFDNGDLPADDRVPDSGSLTYFPFECVPDCFGTPGGNKTYDSCGVCDGDGTSCLCDDIGNKIVADGFVSEWPGQPSCTPGTSKCSEISTDIAESTIVDDSDPDLRIQSQWDLVSLWATDDFHTGAFRFDTYTNTDWSDGVFVRICIDVPNVGPGVVVPGCEGLLTDTMIYVTGNDTVGSGLVAFVVDCNDENCDVYPGLPSVDSVPAWAAYRGVHNEVTYRLIDVDGLTSGARTNVIVYFDNNGQPADDKIPDVGHVVWPLTACVPDCHGDLGGDAKYDSCGICDGDGTSCLCISEETKTIDGLGGDWDGNPVCTIGADGCDLLGVDPLESLVVSPTAVQPQWDLQYLWAVDDYEDLFLRFDTRSATWYNTTEFVRVCFDVEGTSSGSTSAGCRQLDETDFIVFISSLDAGHSLVAHLIDCTVDNCNSNFGWPHAEPIAVTYKGSITELAVPLVALGVGFDEEIDMSVYFDNGQQPSDDHLPDSGFLTYVTADCTQDCFGVYGGTAVLDRCGVCDGDGSTCICDNHNDIVLTEDGFVSDWGTPCTPGNFECKVVVVDPAESDDNKPYGIKAQWDIIRVWATNDGLREYIRWDTKVASDYSHQEFVRICLDIPNTDGGQEVDGCEGLLTDIMIYVQENDQTEELEAYLIDCNLDGNNCQRPPILNALVTEIPVTQDGTSTEVAFYLLDAYIVDATDINAIVYFDNNDLPADDQALITIHPDPCVMHPCGTFLLVSYADNEESGWDILGSVQLRRDKFPATSWIVSINSAYNVSGIDVQFANELIDFPTSDDGDRLVPSLFDERISYAPAALKPNFVIGTAENFDLVSVHAWLVHPRNGRRVHAWAYGIEWREGCPCHPGFIAYTRCKLDLLL